MHKNMPLVNKAKAPLKAVGSISGTTVNACAVEHVAAVAHEGDQKVRALLDTA